MNISIKTFLYFLLLLPYINSFSQNNDTFSENDKYTFAASQIEQWLENVDINYSFIGYPIKYYETDDNSIFYLTKDRVKQFLSDSNISYKTITNDSISIKASDLLMLQSIKGKNRLSEKSAFFFQLKTFLDDQFIGFEILDAGSINDVRATNSLILKSSFALKRSAKDVIVEISNYNNFPFCQISWNLGLKYYYFELVKEEKELAYNYSGDSIANSESYTPSSIVISKTYNLGKVVSVNKFDKEAENIFISLNDSLVNYFIHKYGESSKVESLGHDPIQIILGPAQGILTEEDANWELIELALFEIEPDGTKVKLKGYCGGSYMDISPKGIAPEIFYRRCKPLEYNISLVQKIRNFFNKYVLDYSISIISKYPVYEKK